MSARTRLSVQEIGVMREIVRWRKASKVQRYETPGVHGSVTYSAPTTYGPGWRKMGQMVEWDHCSGGVLTLSRGGGRFHHFESISASSFTEAVDLLVAYGFLPPRFSTAYRAGFSAGRTYQGHAANRYGPPSTLDELLPIGER